MSNKAMSNELNVNEILEKRIIEIRSTIVDAIDNAPAVNSNELQQREIDDVDKTIDMIDELSSEDIVTNPITDKPYQIIIENFHEAPIFIKEIVEYIAEKFEYNKESSENLKNLLEDRLGHELIHAIPILGKENVKPKILFRFSKIKDRNNSISIEPGMFFDGEITIAEYVECLTNPDNMSSSDSKIFRELGNPS